MIYPVNYQFTITFSGEHEADVERQTRQRRRGKNSSDCCSDFLGLSGGGPPPVPTETPELARRLAVGQTRTQSLLCVSGVREDWGLG